MLAAQAAGRRRRPLLAFSSIVSKCAPPSLRRHAKRPTIATLMRFSDLPHTGYRHAVQAEWNSPRPPA